MKNHRKRRLKGSSTIYNSPTKTTIALSLTSRKAKIRKMVFGSGLTLVITLVMSSATRVRNRGNPSPLIKPKLIKMIKEINKT